MIITPLNITFDVDWAIEYYNELENNWLRLKGTMPDDYFYKSLRNAYGWTFQVPVDWDISIPYPKTAGWEIVGRENFKDTEMAFGFAKSMLDTFDTGFRAFIAVCPPGTHFEPHTDGNADILVRGWMPIITNDSFKWITEEGPIVLTPGIAYMIDIAHTHEVINDGSTNGVSLVFDIPRQDMNRYKTMKTHISSK
jgi:hypothetical protein